MGIGLLSGSLICARNVYSGQLTVGDYILFISYVEQLYGPLNALGMYYRSVGKILLLFNISGMWTKQLWMAIDFWSVELIVFICWIYRLLFCQLLLQNFQIEPWFGEISEKCSLSALFMKWKLRSGGHYLTILIKRFSLWIRLMQQAFIDMENMFEMLDQKQEVGSFICSLFFTLLKCCLSLLCLLSICCTIIFVSV